MKLKYLIPLITLLMTSCNNASIASSDSVSSSSNQEAEVSYTTIDPSFAVRITDCQIPLREDDQDNGNELNVHSSYFLFLAIKNKEAFPSPDDCAFTYDQNYLEIKDCVIDNTRSYPQFIYCLKPLKVIDSTSIKIFYLDKLYSSYDVSIKDLAVESSSCASIEKSLDSASEYFPEKITILKDLETYQDYIQKHNYFNYIKNQPTAETFTNYEYAFVRVFRGNLGKDPELNSVFIKGGTLYFDFKSTRNYYEQSPDITMTTAQNYFLCLIRYPSGLNVSNYDIWFTYIYEA